MISVASALTMTAIVGSDGANGHLAALAGTAAGLLWGFWSGCSTASPWHGCASIRSLPHSPACTFAWASARLSTVTRYSGYLRNSTWWDIGCTCWGYRCRLSMRWPSASRSMSYCKTQRLDDRSTCSGATRRRNCWIGRRRQLLALAYILSALLTAVGALVLTARAAHRVHQISAAGCLLQTIAAAAIRWR